MSARKSIPLALSIGNEFTFQDFPNYTLSVVEIQKGTYGLRGQTKIFYKGRSGLVDMMTGDALNREVMLLEQPSNAYSSSTTRGMIKRVKSND